MLNVGDKDHKDIIMKNNTILFLMYSLMSIVWLAFLVLAASNIANAQQPNRYASCESPNEIILPKKACDKRFNDCLPLPKFDHNHFKLKCVEEEYEDKSKPIYAKGCPEGEISHTEKICDAPEMIANDESCYDVEIMCEPESYMIGTRMVLVEDVELIQQEKAQRKAQKEFEEQKAQAREDALEALTRRQDGTFRSKQEIQEIIEGMRGNREK